MKPEDAALKAARAQGCVCDAEVFLTEAHPVMPTYAVAHDEWCPLGRVMAERTSNRQTLFYDPDRGQR